MSLDLDEFDLRARGYVDDWGTERDCCPPAEIPLLLALGDDPVKTETAERIATYWTTKLTASEPNFRSYGTFSYLLTFGCTLHLLGLGQERLFERVLASKPPKHEACVAQHALLRWYVTGSYPTIPRARIASLTFRNVHRYVGKVPEQALYELVADGGAPGWHENAQPYLQLVALLRAQRNGVTEPREVLRTLVIDFRTPRG